MITVLTNKIDFAANTSLVLEASSSRFYRGEYRSLYRKDLVTLFGELEQKKVKQSTREAARAYPVVYDVATMSGLYWRRQSCVKVIPEYASIMTKEYIGETLIDVIRTFRMPIDVIKVLQRDKVEEKQLARAVNRLIRAQVVKYYIKELIVTTIALTGSVDHVKHLFGENTIIQVNEKLWDMLVALYMNQ
jgi:hypothetical protein